MEYTVIYYLFDKGETVSEGICFTSQSKVTGLHGYRRGYGADRALVHGHQSSLQKSIFQSILF